MERMNTSDQKFPLSSVCHTRQINENYGFEIRKCLSQRSVGMFPVFLIIRIFHSTVMWELMPVVHPCCLSRVDTHILYYLRCLMGDISPGQKAGRGQIGESMINVKLVSHILLSVAPFAS